MRPAIEPMPPRRWLRRVWPVIPEPLETTTMHGLAVHEAGHAVYANWIRLPITDARISATGGIVNLDLAAIQALPAADPSPEVSPDPSAAELAGLYCAGRQAEHLAAGLPFRGVIWPDDQDHRNAAMILRHWVGSCVAMGYAQLVARCVLSHHWAEVEAIAARLLDGGQWEPA